jgi:hypothetical protein
MDITGKRVRVVALRKERWQLESKLMGNPREMLPGPLTVRYARCGKPYCHCKKKGAKGHGPYHYVQVKVKGKYTNIYLRKNRELIEEARHYSEYLADIVKLRRINREIDTLLVEIGQSKMKKGVKL